MPVSEHYSDADMDEVALGIAKVARHFARSETVAARAGGQREGRS